MRLGIYKCWDNVAGENLLSDTKTWDLRHVIPRLGSDVPEDLTEVFFGAVQTWHDEHKGDVLDGGQWIPYEYDLQKFAYDDRIHVEWSWNGAHWIKACEPFLFKDCFHDRFKARVSIVGPVHFLRVRYEQVGAVPGHSKGRHLEVFVHRGQG